MKPFPNTLLTYLDECSYRLHGLTNAPLTVIPLKPKDTFALVINTTDAITAMHLLTTALPDDLADVSAGVVRTIVGVMSGHYPDGLTANNIAWVCESCVGGTTLNISEEGYSIVVLISHDMENRIYNDFLSALKLEPELPCALAVSIEKTESKPLVNEDLPFTINIPELPEIKTEIANTISPSTLSLPDILPRTDRVYENYAAFAADVSDKLLFTDPDVDGETIVALDSFQVTASSILGLANVIAVQATRSYSFDNDYLAGVLTEITDTLKEVEESTDVTVTHNHFVNQLSIDCSDFTLNQNPDPKKSLSALLIVYGRVWLIDGTYTYVARVCEVPAPTELEDEE